MTRPGLPADLKDRVERFEHHARKTVGRATPWIVRVGRFGMAAKGTVYVIIAWYALQAAYHGKGDLVDQNGAIQSMMRRRYGRVSLGILAAGLFAYMFWRMAEALLNPENEPHTWKGLFTRLFRFTSGFVYGGLGVAAARLLVGLQSHRRGVRDWTALVMSEPLGKWAVTLTGAGTLGFGLYKIFRAWTGELKGQLELDRYTAWARDWITFIGRLGQAARGVVFVLIGAFAFGAGLHADPDEAKGVGEALLYVEHQPFGPYLLGVIAVGLMSYGLFQFVEAAYRKIQSGSLSPELGGEGAMRS